MQGEAISFNQTINDIISLVYNLKIIKNILRNIGKVDKQSQMNNKIT